MISQLASKFELFSLPDRSSAGESCSTSLVHVVTDGNNNIAKANTSTMNMYLLHPSPQRQKLHEAQTEMGLLPLHRKCPQISKQSHELMRLLVQEAISRERM